MISPIWCIAFRTIMATGQHLCNAFFNSRDEKKMEIKTHERSYCLKHTVNVAKESVWKLFHTSFSKTLANCWRNLKKKVERYLCQGTTVSFNSSKANPIINTQNLNHP